MDDIENRISNVNGNEDELTESNTIPEKLQKILKNLPPHPGVYLYKNENGNIIYVGKAKNLRNRVRSYFQPNRPVDAKTHALVSKIADIELMIVDSEAEALLLEDTLIKKHKPRYNILLRDDKTYPYIRITNEEFPRIFKTRKLIKDGSKYFGPFTEVKTLRYLISVVRTLFMLRGCNLKLTEDSIARGKFKMCLDYHIKKCKAPCEGLISRLEYLDSVAKAAQLLNGKTSDLEKQLEQQMQRFAEALNFEKAAEIRNQYLMVKDYDSHQKIISSDLIDRDVVGMSIIGNSACTLIFKVREGKLIGKRHYIIPDIKGMSDAELIESTIEKWYLESEFIPREISLPVMPASDEFVNGWLKKQSGRTIDITVPKLGDKKKLVNMASANAEFILRDYLLAITKKETAIPHPVAALQKDLNMEKPPLRIECIDNSHLQGSETVSSVVVFLEGRPLKSEYRKFKIVNATPGDDFASMREVVTRRYKRLLEEKKDLPDLVIIDGGKGQLSSAVEVMDELGITSKLTVVGLAKRLEEIYFPGRSDSLLLPKASASLKLLQRIRDEAHRFAITFHRQLRDKRTLQTELTNIRGVGEKTATKLLTEFGSVENIKTAGSEAIAKIAGNKAADLIVEHFKTNGI
jgi:excinuclease ABC subunit C